jgi:hypothetical protein
MIEKMIQRKKRESEAISEATSRTRTAKPVDHYISDTELFAQLGTRMKVIKQ